MQELQRKIITDALTGRIKEIEKEIKSLKEFELDTKKEEVELYFYQEFLNNLDNLNEKSQYWNVAELYFEGEDDGGPYENPISAIDSLVVISRICSLAKYVISAFKNENIYSLYIEGMTLDFQKIREAM
ncbi:MAG: hypothetical protein ACLSVP_02850 [Fusobacterium sp.]